MDNLISLKQASKILDLHPNSLRTKVKERKIKHFRIGKNIKFKRQHLDEFLESKIVNPIYFQQGSLLSLDDYYKLQSGGKKSTMSKNEMVLSLGHGKVIERTTTKLKKKTWKIRFKDEEGNWKQETIKHAQSTEDAVIALSEKVKEIHYRRLGLKPKREKIKLKDFAVEYLEKYAKPNKKTWSSDENRMGFILKFFKQQGKENILISEITTKHIEEFKIWKKASSDCKDQTINRDLAILRKMLNVAVDWDYLDEADLPKIKMIKTEQNLKQRILKQDEESRLLNLVPDYLADIIKFALNTGCRKGEILHLKWNQIDLDEMKIKLVNTKAKKQRNVPMNETVESVLLKRKEQDHNAEYVFTNPATGDRYQDISRSYETAREKAGLKDLRFHDLRHTFATRLIYAGISHYVVSKLLGHHSVTMTERYLHPDYEQSINAVKVLNQQPENVVSFTKTKQKIAYVS